ncbi:ribonuclease 3 precursor, putative [Entamoeba invadens IP1]|uniref:Ribonuclease 3, putative n=1 Tax=Entamoeba invadens IP1 TaxID=370355 RepID=L7FPC3_ENTIV|nr:ribonuclease 3 precursor, putative [Entamoeba invadens IP1]ELP90956.1 ribonuclease 3 precursor, putative [Entamoeba invadens IP1]|eukprot:XP_004257727.1 ribonuclease 3 precursor, putative [Entamoeba invadens IP1]
MLLILFITSTFGQPDSQDEDSENPNDFPSLKPLQETLPRYPRQPRNLPPRFRGREQRGGGRFQRPQPFEPKPPSFIPPRIQRQFEQHTETRQKEKEKEKEEQHFQTVSQQKFPPIYHEKSKIEVKSQHQITPQFQTKDLQRKIIPPLQLPSFPIPQSDPTTKFLHSASQQQVVRPKTIQTQTPIHQPSQIQQKETTEIKKKIFHKPILHTEHTFPLNPVPPEIIPIKELLKKLNSYNMCPTYKKSQRHDYMVYSEYWPGEKCSDDQCTFPKETEQLEEEFMIHGFWPHLHINRNLFCCLNWHGPENFENSLLMDKVLLKDIQKYWMSTSLCRFATYQWDKHGSCTFNVYRGPQGPKSYMKVTLFLHSTSQYWKLLKESPLHVETNKMYKLEDLKDVLKKKFGVEPSFVCRDQISVYEIKICYDIYKNPFNPKPINCGDRVYTYDKPRCDPYVLFKPFPPELKRKETMPRNECFY